MKKALNTALTAIGYGTIVLLCALLVIAFGTFIAGAENGATLAAGTGCFIITGNIVAHCLKPANALPASE